MARRLPTRPNGAVCNSTPWVPWVLLCIPTAKPRVTPSSTPMARPRHTKPHRGPACRPASPSVHAPGLVHSLPNLLVSSSIRQGTLSPIAPLKAGSHNLCRLRIKPTRATPDPRRNRPKRRTNTMSNPTHATRLRWCHLQDSLQPNPSRRSPRSSSDHK